MYLEYFGLKEEPFQLTADPAFLYLSESHSRAKAYMEFAILRGDGFVVITGDIGSGKTLLLQSVLTPLDSNYIVARLFQTQLDELDLLRSFMAELGITRLEGSKAELLAAIRRQLIALSKKGKRVLLVVDEAQHLDVRALEELRMLTGLETEKEKLISIILLGQRELDDVLDSPELDQLCQRIRLRYDLGPLNSHEVVEYVGHRVEIAGGDASKLFTSDAFPEIIRYSGGVPRLINLLCDTSLLTAFVEQHKKVNAEIIAKTVRELRWVPFEERLHRRNSTYGGTETGRSSDYGRLFVYKGERKIATIVLNRRLIGLGRHGSNDVRIPGRMVSRHHAQITTIDKVSFLVDLGSRNGTFVNGQPIRQAQLQEGDSVTIGEYIMRFEGPEVRHGDAENKHAETGEHERTTVAAPPGHDPDSTDSFNVGAGEPDSDGTSEEPSLKTAADSSDLTSADLELISVRAER